ncbi:hypothetical protein [Pseudoalteromonas ardens]|uniref:Uncharacterized protein n=1 Tax=Pseudoalteromonas rubra TaxID=43658 RepID=A0A0L0ETN8_9GAMM|nr:hypothetical protein [Pseudoalteromonas sp. R96]KNC67857.1 hypothetical protein AC626_08220 [Pseudoalteromonas rubra]MDK1311238.1 hypothetical protein [Pseudoalteromonas sp. R96]
MEEGFANHINEEVKKASEIIESKISERESKRFRNMYLVVGFVSFIGIGVITQLVDFYATKAVDSKLSEARQELESAKIFSQLLALATKLDLSDSFTHTDRDTVITLLKLAQNNQQLSSEPAFISLLEKILDSLSSSNNSMHVSNIFTMYEDECLSTPGITITLVQHFGREYLASVDVTNELSKNTLENLNKNINALMSQGAEGLAYAFQVLSQFKMGNRKPDNNLISIIKSLEALETEKKERFFTVLYMMSDPTKMARSLTPELIRVSELTKGFLEAYGPQLNAVLANNS